MSARWDAVVAPGGVGGAIGAIASKSAAHRLLVLAALADAPTRLACATTSQDIEATARCLEALGARVARTADGFAVEPAPREPDGSLAEDARGAVLDCGESGSTLRFMLPVSLALGAEAVLDGGGRLPERPLEPLRGLLLQHGCRVSPQGAWPLRTAGRMEGGLYRMRGDVSSQFATGLLLAAAAIDAEVEVELLPPVESRPYIDLTLKCMSTFKVESSVHETDDGGLACAVPAAVRPVSPGEARVEGDWSNAAFWLAAGAVGPAPVAVRGLDPRSAQGDRAVCQILERFGAEVEVSADEVVARPRELHGCRIDASDIPDLCVPLAIVAACAEGTTLIFNAGRLRAKESDRLATVAGLLRDLGVEVEEGPDSLAVRGRGAGSGHEPCLDACATDAHGDHRIAMAAAVASSRAAGPVRVLGAQAVEKSYPGFFEDWRALGGHVDVEPAPAGERGA